MEAELNKSSEGYWRVVAVDLDTGNVITEEELYEKREDAERNREERQRNWEKRAWDYREYLSTKYQVRFVTHKELEEEKRRKVEEWHTYLRTTYLDPMRPEVFTSCCQKIVADMKRKVDSLSESDVRKIRDEGKRYFTPWQEYGASAKIWSFMDLEEDSEELSYCGMFVKNSLFGTITKRIERFKNMDDFKMWLEDHNQPASIFETLMLEALHSCIEIDDYPRK